MEKAESMTRRLLQLQALGIALYMGDFGTGYSSLSCLHRFPINVLKIDGSFISRIGDRAGGENLEIVRTIVKLAQTLRIDAIAEGVETVEQALQLQTLGCKYGQGNFFYEPVDDKTAETLARLPWQ